MLLDDEKTRKTLTEWIVGTFAACILIFLGIRYVSAIALAVKWLFDLLKPLLIGLILAMILNVPLGFIERHLFQKKPTPRKVKMRRPFAILLSILLVLSIFIGVGVLVIPELIDAVAVVIGMVTNELDKIAAMEGEIDYSVIPFGDSLKLIDIDWNALKNTLETWLKSIMDKAVGSAGGAAGSIFHFFLGVVFAIYILGSKEKLKRQVRRLIHVWLPRKLGDGIIHVAIVCSGTFKQFVAGQTTEAIILGTLCTIGMVILRLPYAPMIGALVGVTALIPYVGATITTIIGAFMILTESPFQASVFVIFLLALQQVENNAIYPKVVGSKMNLPGIWVFAAITVGGNLAGPVGMLLGVPAASACYTLLREATSARERKKACPGCDRQYPQGRVRHL